MDVAPSTYRVVAEDGTPIPLRRRDSSSTGGAILVVPALGMPAARYDEVAAALTRAGHATLVMELRGVGASPVRPSRSIDFGYDALVRNDLAAAAAEGRRLWPDRPLVLLGHSLGGQLAALHAAAAGGQVSGVVLAASGSVYWRAFGLPMGPALAAFAVVASGLGQLLGTFPGHWFGFGRREARGLIADWAHVALTGRWEPRGADLDYEALLRRAPLPVLSIAFERDVYCPPGSAAYLADKLVQGEVTRQVITTAELGTRADHYAWMRAPDAFVARVSAWLAEQQLSAPRLSGP